jgi:hypothetical protein
MTEAAVNYQFNILTKSIILPFGLLILSACSLNFFVTEEAQMAHQTLFTGSDRETNAQSPAKILTVKDEQQFPDEMVVFDGIVFVASTEPVRDRWQLAGWRIGSPSQATDDDQVPPDCTLYPHLGVEDQWIGSCNGHIFVPKDGASHIAVMHTNPDGKTILVQVAPQTDTEGP